MSEQAKSYRAAMRAKAERLGTATSAGKVDCSDFHGEEGGQGFLHADSKQGPRPLSRRAYKSGGAVLGAAGFSHGGRAARKSGGGVDEAKMFGKAIYNSDIKEADESREGHVERKGGMKIGGRAGKFGGGGNGPIGGQTAITSLAAKNAQGPMAAAAEQSGVGTNALDVKAGSGSGKMFGMKKGGKAEGGPLSMPSEADAGPPPGPPEATSAGVEPGDSKLDALISALEHHHKKGKKHDDEAAEASLGAKRGGKARAAGGKVDPDEAEDNADQAAQKKSGGGVYDPNIKLGPRDGYAKGGKTKGRTNIHINIGQLPGGGAPPDAGGGTPPPLAAPPPGPGAVPVPPPAPPPGMPPGGAMGAPPPGPPPMPPPGPMGRKHGGRAYPIDDGAGGGKGRLQKIKAYGLVPPKGGKS